MPPAKVTSGAPSPNSKTQPETTLQHQPPRPSPPQAGPLRPERGPSLTIAATTGHVSFGTCNVREGVEAVTMLNISCHFSPDLSVGSFVSASLQSIVSCFTRFLCLSFAFFNSLRAGSQYPEIFIAWSIQSCIPSQNLSSFIIQLQHHEVLLDFRSGRCASCHGP